MFKKDELADEDPERLIYPWTSHVKVPKWAEADAYNNCKHCKAVFKSGHKHNCRLCGELYCSACTGKFHLPTCFELKGKKGTSRVCMTCRDGCLEQRKKEKAAEAEKEAASKGVKKRNVLKSLEDEEPVSSSSSSPTNGGTLEIEPPEWEDISNFIDCAKCRKKGGKAHNCRACGKMFCSKCTSKMTVPPSFEKKGKDGPSRVCDNCRFLIVSGAKLVDKKSSASSNSNSDSNGADPPRKRWGSQSSARSCLVSGCSNPRVTKKGYCASHANQEDMADIASDASLVVRLDGELSSLCKIAIQPDVDHMTLADIDRMFKRQAAYPQPFNYIYNNEVIPQAFYEVFLARHFRGVVLIRERQVLSKSVADAISTSDLRPIVDDVPKHNNPFKRSEVAAAHEESKKKKEEEEAKKVPVFHKPTIRSAAPVLPPTTSPSPPPPAPSSLTATSISAFTNNDPSIDPFKARAKNVFGAK